MAMDPFAVLMDIERKCKRYAVLLPREKEISEIWQGLGFLLNNLSFVTPVFEIKEVIIVPEVTQLPASASWFLGVANFRGHVLPITDLQGFLFETNQTITLASRVLVVGLEKSNVGFLVQQLVGIQHFFKKDVQALSEISLDEKLRSSVQGSFLQATTAWSILSLKELCQTAQFYHVAKETEK